jgi:hypothetical protein
MPVKAPVINTTGLLIFRFLHDFRASCRWSMDCNAGKLMGRPAVYREGLFMMG